MFQSSYIYMVSSSAGVEEESGEDSVEIAQLHSSSQDDGGG